MTATVHVEFVVSDEAKFLEALQRITDDDQGTRVPALACVGYRAGDNVSLRAPLKVFVEQMETKLRKNDHKTDWHRLPIEALLQLLEIELAEFKVALQYMPVKAARAEAPDIANFAMMLYDRLGAFDPEQPANHRTTE